MVYVAIDTGSGELLTISEWTVKWRHISRKLNVDEKERDEKDSAKYVKQVIVK